jgi:hypothetical protein
VNSLRLSDIKLANNVLKEKYSFEAKLVVMNSLAAEPALEIITHSFRGIKDYAGNIAELTIDLSQL